MMTLKTYAKVKTYMHILLLTIFCVQISTIFIKLLQIQGNNENEEAAYIGPGDLYCSRVFVSPPPVKHETLLNC